MTIDVIAANRQSIQSVAHDHEGHGAQVGEARSMCHRRGKAANTWSVLAVAGLLCLGVEAAVAGDFHAVAGGLVDAMHPGLHRGSAMIRASR